ncbi:hypothetical protein MiYa_03194 [Microcystis aeruginosa NIES-2519]|uniref:Uncharacterized protein n=1 Tax=Microcystis aeruginosa NIES-2519 TaxID=2303981 RepID=A0A5A5REZ9_MICAE|nr:MULTISPECIES: hypothetical protein [Microcystis]GCA71652.1 hypothetical protein MiYa_03194 [Microcystis aeruginosa NIES-2519]GCA85061.1 hypothetical protein MiHa_03038 [Microcystis aeruginosa NIES-2522]GCA90933.1 hypothetical protein MiTa_04294 [Microcystis aeruginosa NIES-4264]CCI33121.1 conserved hypothetical protein [Microcystis sp. T1-4]
MNSLQTSVERENLGQFLLENLQDITDKLDQIVTDSDRIILDNLLQETQILLEQVKDNSKTYQARADIFCQINQLWFQVWKQYKNEVSARELIQYIDQFTNQITAYSQLFIGLAQINEGKTGEEKADLIRVVEGSRILSETIDVFIDMFADSELEQIDKGAKNTLSVSNRTITEYFQDTETSHLVTQLRAYSSLIIFRIQEGFNSRNVSSENTSHSLTDNFNDIDASRQNLTDLVNLETEKSSSENWLDNLSGSISNEEAFEKALEYGRVFRQNVSSETTSHSLTDDLSDLDPWTRDLVGVVDLGSEDPKESYIDYLVDKYR